MPATEVKTSRPARCMFTEVELVICRSMGTVSTAPIVAPPSPANAREKYALNCQLLRSVVL
ncbi:hypothetical protein HK414_03200 [Ramlibacter terrae]|uniref:Uncharacterized protein n=1 Tax=Ramlibacter terrae TaxID=2732511 RepID=A0ABX6P0E0_9BURK|nr:hypothetical protein HK414_03200 [Ramlibacter terrae]